MSAGQDSPQYLELSAIAGIIMMMMSAMAGQC